MKKLYIFVFLLMAIAQGLTAQEIVMNFSHGNGYYFNIRNIVETTDSCIIVECPMFNAEAGGPDLGDMFYKVTKDGQMKDSLFIEIGNVDLRTLLVSDPNDPDTYLYAYFDLEQDSVLLKMVYFDKDFNLLPRKEIPFGRPANGYYRHDYFLDPYGDIIASFSSMVDSAVVTTFNRIAFDGTVKYSREVPEIRNFGRLQYWHSWNYRQSPLQYSYWGSEWGSDMHDRPSIRMYVIDSLFNVTEDHGFYNYGAYSFGNGWQEHVIPLGEEHYLLSTRYDWDDYSSQEAHFAALIAKFDREHEMVASGLYGETTIYRIAPICTATVGDTLVYYAFMTTDDGIYSGSQYSDLTLLCLDDDLNLKWERHYTYPDGLYWGIPMCVLENGDVAIGSFRYFIPGKVSVVVIRNNGTVSVPEMEAFIRPYAIYPNPTRGQLRLHCSPDVEPAQIELYDLQGRLVHTQRNALESIDMEGLPAGTYTMRVTMADGKVFMDKVVKE